MDPHERLPIPATRREFLARAGNGLGLLALGDLLGATAQSSSESLPHRTPRARSVIFLYMDGGPSQVDTFDPKPRLSAENGEPFKMEVERTQFDDNGNTLGSPWKFRRYGESGVPVSDLFPNVGQCADELCVVRSMTSQFSEHTNANYFLHTGLGQAGRPSMGAWASYGLGSASDELPAFVVLNGDLIPPGGLQCFGSGFLPATHQGSVFQINGGVANIERAESGIERQRAKLDWVARMDRGFAERAGGDDAVESAIANYELAFRMQAAVPELMQTSGESEETRELYGLNAAEESTRRYGQQCLLARRMVERGVRFIELTCPRVGDNDRWDQHSNLEAHHAANARAVDQPIAGLLKDLKRRGLLDSTLVVWSGEFGRTPFAQGSDGRDHNPFGFSIWLAGGGVRGGTIYGATDEYGYKAVEGQMDIHDLHALILHLLGIDHKRLTFPFGGRDMRLTDVHGRVVRDLIA